MSFFEDTMNGTMGHCVGSLITGGSLELCIVRGDVWRGWPVPVAWRAPATISWPGDPGFPQTEASGQLWPGQRMRDERESWAHGSRTTRVNWWPRGRLIEGVIVNLWQCESQCHRALNISHDPWCNDFTPWDPGPENRIGQNMGSVRSSCGSDNEPVPGLGSFCSSVMTDPAFRWCLWLDNVQTRLKILVQWQTNNHKRNKTKLHPYYCFQLVCWWSESK